MKEENILYAELKTEFKQQEEIWNIFSLTTVQEDESGIERGIEKDCIAESARIMFVGTLKTKSLLIVIILFLLLSLLNF
jgi:hypothetical protein